MSRDLLTKRFTIKKTIDKDIFKYFRGVLILSTKECYQIMRDLDLDQKYTQYKGLHNLL